MTTAPDTRPAPQHPVRSTPEPEPPKAAARRAGPSIGVFSPRSVERAFTRLLYTAMALLALLSVLGTFYGMRGQDAPLAHPLDMLRDAWDAPGALGLAFGIQLILTLAQYGARQYARYDRRWWLGYLAALGISVYYNIDAYQAPAVALGAPWLLALALIIAGDVLPEFLAVKRAD